MSKARELGAEATRSGGASVIASPELHSPTDLGNARRLVDRHGADLINVGATWFAWDSMRWQADHTGEVVRRAKDTAESIVLEAERAPTGEVREALLKHALRSQSAGALKAMVTLASTEPSVVVSADQLDAHPMLLNVQNGTVDLTTGELRRHDRADLITRLAPVPYVPDAVCPIWDRFMNTITGGDHELRAYLLRLTGAMLIGRGTDQKVFMLHGSGDNGKTTFVETSRRVLGDYAAQAQMSTFVAGGRQSVRNDIARLAGRRLVTATEGDETQRLDEGLVKQLTGDDTITARYLYREHEEFRPTFTLMIVTNHLPEIRGSDRAIWRRIEVVPFVVTIPQEGRDEKLSEKLQRELPGILRSMVQGCLEYQRAGLHQPSAVLERSRAYREDQDHVGRFLLDCCLTGDGLSIRGTDLYTSYRAWADAVGEPALSQKALGGKLTALGFERRRIGSPIKYHTWLGIGLLAPLAPSMHSFASR
jgi:putative DNA primase/helicase